MGDYRYPVRFYCESISHYGPMSVRKVRVVVVVVRMLTLHVMDRCNYFTDLSDSMTCSSNWRLLYYIQTSFIGEANYSLVEQAKRVRRY